MNEFLYYFSYIDPEDMKVNAYFDTDYESAIFIRIVAEDEQKAQGWGDEIAEKFMKFLYNDEKVSWKEGGYGSGSGIDKEKNSYIKENWEKVPKVNYGEFPNIETLNEPYD